MPRFNDDYTILEADWYLHSRTTLVDLCPVDLCGDCWDTLHLTLADETPAPSYDDDEYRCARCGIILNEEEDNLW